MFGALVVPRGPKRCLIQQYSTSKSAKIPADTNPSKEVVLQSYAFRKRSYNHFIYLTCGTLASTCDYTSENIMGLRPVCTLICHERPVKALRKGNVLCIIQRLSSLGT